MTNCCEITFDRPEKTYYSGENLHGNVKITIAGDESSRGILITLVGNGKTDWTSATDTQNQSYTNYTGHKEYINIVLYAVGLETELLSLTPGTYNYPLNVSLPASLPTSCAEEYGEIKYEVTVTLFEVFNFDSVFKEELTVIHSLDLNNDPDNRLPLSQSEFAIDLYCCWLPCCSRGIIQAGCKIPHRGYIPGQRIEFLISVFNDSTNDIEGGYVHLQKSVTYSSTSPELHQKTKMYVIHESDLTMKTLRLSRKDHFNSIEVPVTEPSTPSSNLIAFEYILQIVVFSNCCDSDIVIKLPVTIGAFPLTFDTSAVENHVVTTEPAPMATDQSSSFANPPSYSTFEPPSYEDPPSYPDEA